MLLPHAAAAAGANILPKKKITVSVALFGAGGRYGRETPVGFATANPFALQEI